MPSVGEAVGKPGTRVGLAVTIGFSVPSVAVANVAVRFGGGNVAVSAGGGRVGATDVSLGFARTGVEDGGGDDVGTGDAVAVGTTAVDVAGPGKSNGN